MAAAGALLAAVVSGLVAPLRAHVTAPTDTGARFRELTPSQAAGHLEAVEASRDMGDFVALCGTLPGCRVLAGELDPSVHPSARNCAALYLVEFQESLAAMIVWAVLFRGGACSASGVGPETELRMHSDLIRRVAAFRGQNGVRGTLVDARPSSLRPSPH
ncbi:hypothetical protein JKP88DRAFT_273050 [Tribonema minus]|uniref:Uncharacterized protein n=1 Tax=Tribonema minus TaxID=303371 RepID=A0A835Z6E4_9STRA|nr:hypothetical protein JKP88DRAFT_273050 [Tribonema minus]